LGKEDGVQGARRPGGRARARARQGSGRRSRMEYADEGGPSLLPSLELSCRAITIATPTLGTEQGGEGIDGGAGIGMRVDLAAPAGPETAPMADEDRPAEQIGPDLHPVEPALAGLGVDADEGGSFREERQLDGGGASGAGFAAFGHGVARSVSSRRARYQENRPRCGQTSGFPGEGDTLLAIVYQGSLKAAIEASADARHYSPTSVILTHWRLSILLCNDRSDEEQATVTISADIFSFAGGRPLWEQDLLRRIYETCARVGFSLEPLV
jgi:hypothetical protein